MKCQIPQISWHSRDPVLSIDFQPGNRNIKRLASGGTDSHVLIWYITYQENKTVKIDCASDLTRHSKSVNVVRFSPDGELLVSGDDEGAMFVWQLKEREDIDAPIDDDNLNQEDWCPVKLLRGHMDDIYDVSWSKDGKFLASASMDNSVIVWDMLKFQKVHIFSESKGYVQGVAWDPLNSYIATIGSDRTLRVYNINSKKRVSRVQWAPWAVKTEKGPIRSRLFYDDTLQSYFRRLSFTPDGELLIVPSGILERDEAKFQNTTYIFARHSLNKPAFSLPVFHFPSRDKYSVAVRCNPLLFKLRGQKKDTDKENEPSNTVIDLPYRMLFAVAASDSIYLYDTQQRMPFGYVSNIHYTHLTDLTWSPDGKLLVASSTDGYCSVLVFNDGELGEEYVPEPTPVEESEEPEPSKSETPSITTSPVVSETHTPEKSKPESEQESEKPLSTTPKDTKITEPESTPNSDAAKVNKRPKFTIKNFFMSPKAASAKTPATSVSQAAPRKDEVSPTYTKPSAPKSFSVFKGSEVGDGVKEDQENSNSLDIVFEQISSKNPESGVELDKEMKSASSDLVKKHSVIDASDGDAVLCPSDLVDKVMGGEDDKQNDWKLELSQDSTPMDVDPTPNTSESEVKSDVVTSEKEPLISSNSETKATEVNPAEPKKRRVAFVTLSSKASMSSKP